MYYDVIGSHRLSFVNTFLCILLIKIVIAHRKLAQMPGIAGDAVWFPAYPGTSRQFPAFGGFPRHMASFPCASRPSKKDIPVRDILFICPYSFFPSMASASLPTSAGDWAKQLASLSSSHVPQP